MAKIIFHLTVASKSMTAHHEQTKHYVYESGQVEAPALDTMEEGRASRNIGWRHYLKLYCLVGFQTSSIR